MSQGKNKGNKTQLSTLPPELFERVAQNLESDDLCNLRLVTREAASKVLKTYKEVCFHTKSLVLCDHDHMQAGIAAAKSGAFGLSIKKVRIYVNRGQPVDLEDLEDRVDSDWPFDIALLTKFFLCLDSRTPRDIALQLCELPRVDETIPRGIPRSAVVESFSPGLEDISPLVNILAALSATSLVLRELYVGEDYWSPPAHKLEDSFQRHWLDEILRSLKRLDIRFWTNGDAGMQQLAALVANAHQLESLKMGIYVDDNERYIDADATDAENLMDAMGTTKFSRLRELHLDCLTMRVAPFVDFVRDQPRLQNIKLTYCSFKRGSKRTRAREELKELRQMTGLDILEVDGDAEQS